jgi:UDP-N-acetylglucosamine:LPS N-acetylglucosamine transferase
MNVLVAPLDWGLGHATRCVPVINELQRRGHSVFIAGSGRSLDLLKIEFPAGKFFEIASYNIEYSRSLVVGLMLKTPALLSVIKKEHEQVAGIVQKEKIDFIISDNRYGCYHKSIPSAIITHQLSIRASVLSPIVNHFNKKFIARFNECWVPDTPDHQLSGQLSINPKIASKFIGPLSRLARRPGSAKAQQVGTTQHSNRANTFGLLALVSGPEPQRTVLESLLIHHLPGSGMSYRLVRGLPNEQGKTDEHTFNHLSADKLSALIAAADIIISRPGYSTIMDLAALKKKAIFVPTPGQTEQLYLAQQLEEKKIAPCVSQHQLSLPGVLKRMKDYTGFTQNYFNTQLLEKTLDEFLD